MRRSSMNRIAAVALGAWVALASTAKPADARMPVLMLPEAAHLSIDQLDEEADDEFPCMISAPRLSLDDDAFVDPPFPDIVEAFHTEKNGALFHYDQISRRWDRPEDYDAYRYPIELTGYGSPVGSGYDLDQPDAKQRRGTMRAVGHGGFDLPQVMGAPVKVMPLAHQVGDAKVVYVGPLFGNTVVTLHEVREGGTRGHYVVLYGHLQKPAPDLMMGRNIPAGTLIGFVGDSESEGRVHLHLEARRVRDELDIARLGPNEVLTQTIVTDPRNVLPLRPTPPTTLSCRERILGYRRADTLGDFHLEL